MAGDGIGLDQMEAPRRRGRLVPALIIAILMAAEGVGVYLLAKAVGPSPEAALAGGVDGLGLEADDSGVHELAEVELAECRPTNSISGRLISFDIRVSALVLSADLERAERLAKDNRARLEDSVNTVIRGAELRHFGEPRLDTIRRGLRHEFDRIFGDDELIKEVLIPRFLQSESGV
jgi:hypothetical protein